MSLTFTQATDAILGRFKTAWDTTGLVAGYKGVEFDRPAGQVNWAFVMIEHAGSQQTTLGGNQNRDFNRFGTLRVQIHVPIGQGFTPAYPLAKVVVDAFEGVSESSSLWYRDVRIQEIDEDGGFERLQVLVDFSYDETK